MVPKQDAEAFSKVWLKDKLILGLDDASVQFATDFANEVLKQFYFGVVPQIVYTSIVQHEAAKAAEAQQQKVTLEV